METVVKALGVFTLAMLLIVAVSVIGAYPTKWLVNYVLASSLFKSASTSSK